MLSEIVNMVWLRAREKGLEFEIKADPALPRMLCGDEVRIKQILLNVVTNAVKYTREGLVVLTIGCRTGEDELARLVPEAASGAGPSCNPVGKTI